MTQGMDFTPVDIILNYENFVKSKGGKLIDLHTGLAFRGELSFLFTGRKWPIYKIAPTVTSEEINELQAGHPNVTKGVPLEKRTQ